MVMATEQKEWTRAELDRLPDDGNKYELVRGELFVTPGPRPRHDVILARLSHLLSPYVIAQALGMVFHPRAVVQFEGSQVEPDLMVRNPQSVLEAGWQSASPPILVVEVLSRITRWRDYGPKRDLYTDAGVAEYWIVDQETQSICIIKTGVADVVTSGELRWMPANAREPLVFDVLVLFA